MNSIVFWNMSLHSTEDRFLRNCYLSNTLHGVTTQKTVPLHKPPDVTFYYKTCKIKHTLSEHNIKWNWHHSKKKFRIIFLSIFRHYQLPSNKLLPTRYCKMFSHFWFKCHFKQGSNLVMRSTPGHRRKQWSHYSVWQLSVARVCPFIHHIN
jgi:hypothetical protein